MSGTHDLLAGIDGVLVTGGGGETGVAAEDIFEGPDFFRQQSTPGACGLQGTFEEQGRFDEQLVVLLVDLWMDDDLDEAGFVFQCHEHEPFGRGRSLAHDDDAGERNHGALQIVGCGLWARAVSRQNHRALAAFDGGNAHVVKVASGQGNGMDATGSCGSVVPGQSLGGTQHGQVGDVLFHQKRHVEETRLVRPIAGGISSVGHDTGFPQCTATGTGEGVESTGLGQRIQVTAIEIGDSGGQIFHRTEGTGESCPEDLLHRFFGEAFD